MNNILSLPAQQVMSQNGKSFYFASFFFTKEQLAKIAKLYQVCRFIDDTADEQHPDAALVALARLEQELASPDLVSDFQQTTVLLTEWGIQRRHLRDLMAGASFDARGEKIETQDQFYLYCYRVAGVVGLMMCPLLGTKDANAYPYAIDLGMGMQITNICRDVLEDAQNGRCYFPKERMKQLQLEAKDFIPGLTPEVLKTLVREYLYLADHFYKSAYRGLAYLPFRSRICIVLAGEVYRHIGVKILENHCNVLTGRCYLSFTEKIVVAIRSLGIIFSKSFWQTEPFQSSSALLNLEVDQA